MNTIVKIITVSVFNWKDIPCYAIGCAIIAFIGVLQLHEWPLQMRHNTWRI
ncbi:DUF2809 domain-containing protein [Ktedonospora formicarum]|uniref:DUF2809 domain-containing protein n=1 Tax=Ktedonospora formicarum TaxID=2778364 RepID=UPI001C68B724|nr:DUF2809 domain-containing protein [Ktedonospora formicarum]